jgi:hypothetical protein
MISFDVFLSLPFQKNTEESSKNSAQEEVSSYVASCTWISADLVRLVVEPIVHLFPSE